MPPNVVVPPAIRRSPLMRAGGFAVVDGLLDEETFGRLTAEAIEAHNRAVLSDVAETGDTAERGGAPARHFASADGGPLQQSLYNAPALSALLSGYAALPVAPTGEAATFSYYAAPGDFIDVHRDIVSCDLAVITCLLDNAPHAAGGSLCVYPDRVEEPVASIRRSPTRGAALVHLLPGQTIVLLGGTLPHRVVEVAEGQQRVVSVMCFRAAC